MLVAEGVGHGVSLDDAYDWSVHQKTNPVTATHDSA